MRQAEKRKEKKGVQEPASLPELIQEVLERMREGVDALTQGLRPQPQPIPIPVNNPVYRRRKS
jgi:hypothetical protein